VFATTVSVNYLPKLLFKSMSLTSNLYNQGLRMKNKNSKLHALVYINPFVGVVEAHTYPLNNCSICSYTSYYVVVHGSHDCSL